jgi:hypothetical protein
LVAVVVLFIYLLFIALNAFKWFSKYSLSRSVRFNFDWTAVQVEFELRTYIFVC